MSSPTNRNAKLLSKITEPFHPDQNIIHVKKPHVAKKEKSSTYTQTENTLIATDCVLGVRHNDCSERSCLHTSSRIISKGTSHQKETDPGTSSCGCMEYAQSESLGVNCTKKPMRQGNQYSPESLKERTVDKPSKGKEENVDQLSSLLPCEYKNIEGNNCEGLPITEMNETSEPFPLNSSTDDSVDKKKERRKMMKKLAKDEKRKQRELEYKKNLQPREQRIQVIDHNTFQKILKDAGSLNNENKKSVFNSEEFPALNVMKRNDRIRVLPWQDPPVQSDIEKANVQDKSTHKAGVNMKVPETTVVNNRETINKSEKQFGVPNKLGVNTSPKKIGKLPKKRDPIQIDILQCIKMVKSKDVVVEPRKKLSALERKKDSSLISGNELDSSNPQRSRGKKRENPKKKRPTRLKLVILHERELRNQIKKLPESDVFQSEKASFGRETTSVLLTAGESKLELMAPVTDMLDKEVVETVPGVEDISKECKYTCESITAVPVTNRLLKPDSKMYLPNDLHITDKHPYTLERESVSDRIPSLLSPTSEFLNKVKQEVTSPTRDIYKCEVPSSEIITAVPVTNQLLQTDSKMYLPNNLPITDKHPHTLEKKSFSDHIPSLLNSASEVLDKVKQEVTSPMKESCYTVNLKLDQYSLAPGGDDTKHTPISSDAIKQEIPNNSQDSLETFSFIDRDSCNKPHQMDCKEFARDKVCGSSTDNKEITQITEIHSRKFRPYCDHFITPEINSSVSALLQDIVKFHDRQFEKDPVKANARRRHVTGLREVLKYLKLKRLKLIVIAPDLELVQGKGGICDIVEQLKEGARNQEVPYVFALQRRALGKLTIKKVPVSCIGIINYDGTEKNFHSLIAALDVARAQYQEALTNVSFQATHSEEVDINKQVIEAALMRLTGNSTTHCSEDSKICPETDQKWEE